MIVATLTKGRLRAALSDDGVWHSVDAFLNYFLNAHFGPAAVPPSQAAGWSEVAGQAHAAAAGLGAGLEWGLTPIFPDEGVVY